MMFQRILVPLDGSKHAERAIPVAARISRATGGTLVFIRVIFAPTDAGNQPFANAATESAGSEAQMEKAEDYLSSTVTTAYAQDLAGLPTEREVELGNAAPAIFAIARQEQIDLIVMCSRGETGLKRWVLGSVAHEAVHHTPVPVLILHERGAELPEQVSSLPLHVLLPLDGSPLAEAALEPTARLMAALAAPAPLMLHLLSVVDVPSPSGKFKGHINVDALLQDELKQEATDYLHQIEVRIRATLGAELHMPITSSVVVNPSAARAIIDIAEHKKVPGGSFALIAMATHGRTGLKHLLMGSVTEQVLDHTRLPLLIVRPHELKEQATASVREAAPHAENGKHISWHFIGKSKTPIAH
jgi:nucleotide-binding universal stress UspA family protein